MSGNSGIYQDMIENIEDYAILHLDVNGNIQNWNRGAEKIKGYSRQEIVGKNFRIFYTDKDLEDDMPGKAIAEAALKGKSQFESWRVRKDGSRFWGNVIITAHYDSDKNVTGFTKISYDLTEKKLLEEKLKLLNAQLLEKVQEGDRELQATEARYRLLFFHNPLPMWVFDLKTFKFLDVNEIACSHYGYTKEEFLSMSVLDIRPHDDKKAFTKADHSLTIKPEHYNRGIWQHLKKDGTRMDVEIFGHDILFEGRHARIVIVNDITKRKLAEDRLKHNEEKLQQAQDMAHFGSWEMDFSTGLATWSAEACRIYGLAIEDNRQTYQTWLSFIHPDDLAYVLEQSGEAEKTLSPAGFYHRIILRDGTVKYLFSQSQYEFNHSGKPVGMYGVAHDVTEQKIAEQKIINANRLYSFISGINQLIVHIDSEKALFEEACQIATKQGKFDLAWISLIDHTTKTSHLLSHSNAGPDHLKIIENVRYDKDGPTANVLETGSYYAVNDVGKASADKKVNQFATKNNFNSFIILPVKKSGTVYATLNLFSRKADLFDSTEIALLEEVAGDISFALEVFEKKIKTEAAERKLEHSELRLKQAQSIAHVGSWELNFSEGLALWSDEQCKIYGLKIENNRHTVESWLSYVHPEDIDLVREALTEPTGPSSGAPFYHRIIRKNGAIRHIYMHSQYELNSEGKPVGLYGVSHDLTESKEAENSLVQSEANLRLIMDLIPQFIFVKDFSGKYRFVNRSFAGLYNLSPKELINKSKSGELFSSSGKSKFTRDDREVMKTGTIKVIPEETFTAPSGAERIFHTTKLPYFLGPNKEKAILGIANDITEDIRAASERNALLADIMQRNKNLEQFTYIVSHNLRAPVANIIGLSELLQMAAHDPAEEKVLLNGLSVSVRKLDDVIKDLNNILQIRNQGSEKKEQVNFSDLCEDIQTSLGNLIRAEDVAIITDFSAVSNLYAVKSYLYSIFVNLISNSIKYRRTDTPLVIEIHSELNNGKVALTFKDNGLGMDMDRVGHQVFSLYKRFHTHIEGKGMGLYMVKSHVETMGGNIFLESAVNVGSTFKILFNT